MKKVTAKRQEATLNKQESLSAVYKLVSNSCYGRMGKAFRAKNSNKERSFLGLNLSKREAVQYVAGERLHRHLVNPKFKRLEILGEVFEVTKKKGRQTDKVPIHIGLFFFVEFKDSNLFLSAHNSLECEVIDVAIYAGHAKVSQFQCYACPIYG